MCKFEVKEPTEAWAIDPSTESLLLVVPLENKRTPVLDAYSLTGSNVANLSMTNSGTALLIILIWSHDYGWGRQAATNALR